MQLDRSDPGIRSKRYAYVNEFLACRSHFIVACLPTLAQFIASPFLQRTSIMAAAAQMFQRQTNASLLLFPKFLRRKIKTQETLVGDIEKVFEVVKFHLSQIRYHIFLSTHEKAVDPFTA